MKVEYPGLLKEKLPSGNFRYRVRVQGNPSMRIRLNVSPDDKKFAEHYHAARAGIQLPPEQTLDAQETNGSLSWLIKKYMAAYEKQVEAGHASPKTLKKKRNLFRPILDQYGRYAMLIPPSEIVKIRDERIDTPVQADDLVGAISTMYRWAMERGLVGSNPTLGVSKIGKRKSGATPWTVQDLKRFRRKHEPGTTAHRCLTILMFTACRIGDVVWLGPDNEFDRKGVLALGWQPGKKNSNYVEIPMLPPLVKATRGVEAGRPYVETIHGKPFTSSDGLSQRFSKWCREAGLKDRTAHGVRKAAGHLLAMEGCTQYQIMSIHGHSDPKSSQVYTKGVERWKLAVDASRALESMEW